LKDFVIGSFGKCESELETTPIKGNGDALTGLTAEIPVNGQLSVKDSATFDSGRRPDLVRHPGVLPLRAGRSHEPDDVRVRRNEDRHDAEFSNSTTQPILSDAATVTSAGSYCWRGVFTASTNGPCPMTPMQHRRVLHRHSRAARHSHASIGKRAGRRQDPRHGDLDRDGLKPGDPVINSNHGRNGGHWDHHLQAVRAR
jgi:hypothetical protein